MSDFNDVWKDEDRDNLDLELENQALELDLTLKRGFEFDETSADPKLQNKILKSYELYEDLDEQPKRPMRSLFPEECIFPSAVQLSRKELSEKLAYILEIFSYNNIDVALNRKLPDESLYTYLTTEVIPHEETFPAHDKGFTYVIDGCDGYCPDCFQKDYCDTKDKIGWDEEGADPDSGDDAVKN